MASPSQEICYDNSASTVSVQEFVKQPLSEIPINYVHHDRQPQIATDETQLSMIPTIDMNKLSSHETPNRELEKFHSACKEWGFFQLVNHGVSRHLLEKLNQDIEEFFKLPVEEKMKCRLKPGEFEGYGPVALEEKRDWGDRLFMIANPISLRKPHLFSDLPLSLRDALVMYIQETQKVGLQLFGLIAKCLELEMKEMTGLFEDGFQTMRITYYPRCPQPEKVVGFRPHSDASAITILHQINDVDGLQIKKDGVWIPIHFHPNAFVVNIGDIMEILSNGIYQSIEHKVTVNTAKERLSIAMFFKPKLEAEIGPMSSLTNSQSPPLFKRIKMDKYVKDFFSRPLNGKSYLEHMKIEDNNEGDSI